MEQTVEDSVHLSFYMYMYVHTQVPLSMQVQNGCIAYVQQFVPYTCGVCCVNK